MYGIYTFNFYNTIADTYGGVRVKCGLKAVSKRRIQSCLVDMWPNLGRHTNLE